MKEKILITGHNGFIGSNLLKRYPGAMCYGREERDFSEEVLLSFINNEPDIIFHLASAGSKKGNYSEQEIFETNVVETWDLLRVTRDIAYKAFVNFSTSSVYGIKEGKMFERDKLEPNFLYASTKAAAEMLCRNEAIEHKKPVVSVRPFSVYGPGMQDSKLIPVLFDRISHGQEIQLAEGNHDYIYIDDFMDALGYVLDNVGHLAGSAVNIGTGKQTSNLEVARLVADIVGEPLRLSSNKFSHNHTSLDSLTWMAGRGELYNLGWRPKVDLREGLERMYEG